MHYLHHLRHLFLPHDSNNQRAKILHPSSLGLIIGFFLIFQYFIVQVSNTFPQILGFASQIPADEIIRLTNLERQVKGLPLLQLNAQLATAAGRKAADMFARNYWAHISPVGTQPWFFISDAGYGYRYAGENLARDFSDPGSVIKAWLASPTHKENLLSNRYQDIGVAVVDGVLDGHETTLVVQMFGTQLSAGTTPAVGRTAAFVVEAGDPTPVPSQVSNIATESQPVQTYSISPVSPFEITKVFTVGLLGIFAVVLVLDIFIVNRKSLIRWTGKSFAHLVFVVLILIAATTVIGGKIL